MARGRRRSNHSRGTKIWARPGYWTSPVGSQESGGTDIYFTVGQRPYVKFNETPLVNGANPANRGEITPIKAMSNYGSTNPIVLAHLLYERSGYPESQGGAEAGEDSVRLITPPYTVHRIIGVVSAWPSSGSGAKTARFMLLKVPSSNTVNEVELPNTDPGDPDLGEGVRVIHDSFTRFAAAETPLTYELDSRMRFTVRERENLWWLASASSLSLQVQARVLVTPHA